MKYIEKSSFLLALLLLFLLSACQKERDRSGLQPNPFKNSARNLPSINKEAPEVLAQKMFEADQQAVSKVGPRILRDWSQKKKLNLIDLSSQNSGKSIAGAIKYDGKKLPKLSKQEAVVVFASIKENKKVESFCKKLIQKGYTTVFMLDGGVEAWFSLYGKR